MIDKKYCMSSYLAFRYIEDDNKDCGVRLFKALESHQECQFVLGYIPTYLFVQSVPQAPYDETDIANRHIQLRYDKICRQFFIL